MLTSSKIKILMALVLTLGAGLVAGFLYGRSNGLELAATKARTPMPSPVTQSMEKALAHQSQALEEIMNVVLSLEQEVYQIRSSAQKFPSDQLSKTASNGRAQSSHRVAVRHQPGEGFGGRRKLTTEELDRRQRELWEAMEWTDSINPDSPPSDG